MKRLLLLSAALGAFCASPALASPPRGYATTSIPAGNTVTDTTTNTVIADRYSMTPATPNDLRVGQVVSFDCRGIVSTPAVTPGTLTLAIEYAQSTFGSPTLTVLGTTGAFTPPSSLASTPITINGWCSFPTMGTSGVGACYPDVYIVGNGLVASGRPSGMTTGTTGFGTGFNTTASNLNMLALYVQWGSVLTTDSITLACKWSRDI